MALSCFLLLAVPPGGSSSYLTSPGHCPLSPHFILESIGLGRGLCLDRWQPNCKGDKLDSLPTLRCSGASQVVLVVKNLPASSGDIRDACSIPGLGRFPGEGNGNTLQYSCCLENPMDRGAWWATVHGVTKSLKTEESDTTEAT